MGLQGKKILVIGASRGIGEEISKSLIKEKADLIALSRNKINFESEYFKFDITNENSINSLKRYLEKNNILINGIVFVAAKSYPPQKNKNSICNNLQHPNDFKELINTNLFSIYNCVFNLENFLKNDSSIVFISSIGAHLAFPNNTGYQVSKAGLESMSRSISYELGSRNIRANSVVLGYFKTQMTMESFQDENMRKERANRTLLNRWGNISEINGAIRFLLSDESSYVTGSSIVIDGGWLAKGL